MEKVTLPEPRSWGYLVDNGIIRGLFGQELEPKRSSSCRQMCLPKQRQKANYLGFSFPPKLQSLLVRPTADPELAVRRAWESQLTAVRQRTGRDRV